MTLARGTGLKEKHDEATCRQSRRLLVRTRRFAVKIYINNHKSTTTTEYSAYWYGRDIDTQALGKFSSLDKALSAVAEATDAAIDDGTTGLFAQITKLETVRVMAWSLTGEDK